MEGNNNTIKFPAKPKIGSPAAANAEAAQIEENFAHSAVVCKEFLQAHLNYMSNAEFEAHGAFLLLWNRDGTYIINDAGMLPSLTMIGFLEAAKADFMMRHAMTVTRMPVTKGDPTPPTTATTSVSAGEDPC